MPTKPLNGSTDRPPRTKLARAYHDDPKEPRPMNRLMNEPVALGAAIRLTLVAAMSFGLSLTDTQLVASMAAIEALLALFTRQSVTPNQLAESRVTKAIDAGREVTATTATTART